MEWFLATSTHFSFDYSLCVKYRTLFQVLWDIMQWMFFEKFQSERVKMFWHYERQSKDAPVLRSAKEDNEKLSPQSVKLDDNRNVSFPGKSDFFRAVNHSFIRGRCPFAILHVVRATIASSRDKTRSRSALRSRPVNSTILRQCSTKRFTMVLWSCPVCGCAYELVLAIRLTPLPNRPSSPAPSVDPDTSSFPSLPLHARLTTSRCVNRWPPHSSITNVIPDSKCR